TPFENKRHDSEFRADQFSAPTPVINGFNDASALRGGYGPASKPFDHASSHGFARFKARSGAPPLARTSNIMGVGALDLCPDGIIGEPLGKFAEELTDLRVTHQAHFLKRLERATHGVTRHT